jgi:hypothetical protein
MLKKVTHSLPGILLQSTVYNIYFNAKHTKKLSTFTLSLLNESERLRTAAITGLLFVPRVNVNVGATVMMPAGDNS